MAHKINHPNNEVIAFFDKHQIKYTCYHHPAVFSAAEEESKKLHNIIPGAHTKSLFFKNKHKKYFLICVMEHKRVDVKKIIQLLPNTDRLSFGNELELETILRLKPGSVTPYGLIYDDKQQVEVILDQELLMHDLINFHPLQNDMTIGVTSYDFLRFLQLINRTPLIVKDMEKSGS